MNSSSLWENKDFEKEAQKKHLENFLNDVEIEKLKLEFPKLVFFDFPKILKQMRRCRFWGPKSCLKTQLNVRKIALKNRITNSPENLTFIGEIETSH